MPSGSGMARYEFLDTYAHVIEQLLPTVCAVAFFDACGNALRDRGPVPVVEARSQIRAVLESVALGPRCVQETLCAVNGSQCAAALVLYGDRRAGGRHRSSPPVAGVCLIVLGVDLAQSPSLESLHGKLDAVLTCVGHHLAEHAAQGGLQRPADEEARDLEWLFEITAPAVQGEEPQVMPDRGARLSKLIAASLAHLECLLGALLIPERHLRIVRTAGERHAAEERLRRLEPPVLNWVRRKNRPMVVNKPMGWTRAAAGKSPPSPVRLLAVPVSGRASVPAGALMLLRSGDARAFTRAQLALMKHVGRHISMLLETDFDVLTGLHTRSSAQTEVGSWAAARAAPHAAGTHSVIVLDIDHLRAINETRGFDTGDAVILGVARLLAEPLLPAGVVVARIAGDEFAVALAEVEPVSAVEMARALQQAVALQSEASNEESVSLSCGIASFTEPSEFESALALAQLACQTAKDHGRGRVEVYQDTDDSMVRRKSDLVLVRRLRDALRNDHLRLFAQRIMPLQGRGDAEGYELLLRSPQARPENHAPAELLAAAQRNQLAPALDLWVIEHALAEAIPYRSVLRAANATLSINITGPSLTDAALLERVKDLIRASRIGPALITFEITETIAVLSFTKALRFIRELRAMGCRFALDDFGTGANSLKNLTALPVDRVKIDGSFVTDILSNRQSAAMVRAIVSLTKELGIGTVAEYAENGEIIGRLRELGVEHAQGYGVEKPRPFKEVLDELKARESAKNAALGREI